MTTRLLRCEGCETRYDVSGRSPGKRVRCPRCRTILVVPAAEEAARSSLESSRLRRAKGPTCARHRKARGRTRCADCGAWACGECLAAPPVDHFCRPCADRRGVGGALPVDLGLLATPLLAVRLLGRTVHQAAAWNFVTILVAFTAFAIPIALAVLAFQSAQQVDPGQVWDPRGTAAGAFFVLLVGCYLTYYGVLVPSGCSVLMDAALRGKGQGYVARLGEAFRRVGRSAHHLLLVCLVQVLVFLPYLLLVLAAAYWVDAVLNTLVAVLLLVLGFAVGFFGLVTCLGLAVPVAVLEERPALSALSRSWELVRPHLWTVSSLVLAWVMFSGFCALLFTGLARVVGAPVVLATVVLDAVWPALLVALYHGLVAEEQRVPGRR